MFARVKQGDLNANYTGVKEISLLAAPKNGASKFKLLNGKHAFDGK